MNDEKNTMFGYQIQRCIDSNSVLRESSRGVYASDTLPRGRLVPGFYVTNLSPINHEGTHWICVFKPQNTMDSAEVFDPYGVPPSVNGISLSHEKVILFNDVAIQGNDLKNCAKFCLYFAFYRSIGASMLTIVNSFSDSKQKNDEIVDVFMGNKCRTY